MDQQKLKKPHQQNTSMENQPIPHYYGNIVRVIFIVTAAYLLLGLPAMTALFGVPVIVSIIGVVILGAAAGITNPAKKFSLQLNVFVSLLFLVAFAYLAWFGYDNGFGTDVQIANQLAAVALLVASYFSIKSLRGTAIDRL